MVSVAFSVVAVAEDSVYTETPTVVEAVGDKELLFTFSPVVQAVNVPAVKINDSIIAICFFILSPSFQAISISKEFQMSRNICNLKIGVYLIYPTLIK